MSAAPRGRAVASVSRRALLPNGSDRAFRQLIQDLLGVSSRMETVREALGRMAGISGPQYSLLAAIAHLNAIGAPVTVMRLARHLHVSSTYVTAETGKLLRAGFVAKTPHPTDRRSVRLTVAPRGAAALRALAPTVRAVNDEIFRHLDRAAFATLCRELAAMVPALDDALHLVRRTPPDGRRA